MRTVSGISRSEEHLCVPHESSGRRLAIVLRGFWHDSADFDLCPWPPGSMSSSLAWPTFRKSFQDNLQTEACCCSRGEEPRSKTAWCHQVQFRQTPGERRMKPLARRRGLPVKHQTIPAPKGWDSRTSRSLTGSS